MTKTTRDLPADTKASQPDSSSQADQPKVAETTRQPAALQTQTGVSPKPTDTASVKPINTPPVKPADTAPVKPADAASVKPTDTAPVKPTNAAPIKPTDTASVKPTDTASVKPTDTASVKPADRDPVKPANAASAKRGQSPQAPSGKVKPKTEPPPPASPSPPTSSAPPPTPPPPPPPAPPHQPRQQGNGLLWLCSLLALMVALGTAWFIYTRQSNNQALQQTSQELRQTERQLLLDRINELSASQRDLVSQLHGDQQRFIDQAQLRIDQAQQRMDQATSLSKELADQVVTESKQRADQAVAELHKDFSEIPRRLAQMFIRQLVTQAQLLNQSFGPGQLVVQLLEQAKHLASDQAERYAALLQGIEKDLTRLGADQTEQPIAALLARLDGLREQVAEIRFSPVGKSGERLDTATNADPSADMFNRLGHKLSNTLSSLVIIRTRSDVSIDLNQEQLFTVKLLIESSLDQARQQLALNRPEAYVKQLHNAIGLTRQYLANYPVDKLAAELQKLISTPPDTLHQLHSYQALQQPAQ